MVPRGRGPGSVRAVRVVGYGRASERVRFAFDVVHPRLLDSYTSIGGVGSPMRLGLLSVGARASVERLSASEGGAIRAFSFADLAASESSETRFVCGRNGFYCCVGNSIGLKDDDLSTRFRQIGALERDFTGARVSGH